MKVILNGKSHEILTNATIQKLLEQINIPKAGTAVAVNGSIVIQSNFETHALNENDRVEIIRAVGGG